MPKPRSRVCLLVVDDELYNRELLIRTFARNCDVIAATSVSDALEVMQRTTIDLVLTDQSLVGERGTDLARVVRARWPAVRVVIVTGFDDDPAVADALRDGSIDHVVSKPWAPAALLARVMSLVGA